MSSNRFKIHRMVLREQLPDQECYDNLVVTDIHEGGDKHVRGIYSGNITGLEVFCHTSHITIDLQMGCLSANMPLGLGFEATFSSVGKLSRECYTYIKQGRDCNQELLERVGFSTSFIAQQNVISTSQIKCDKPDLGLQSGTHIILIKYAQRARFLLFYRLKPLQMYVFLGVFVSQRILQRL